MSLLDFGGGLKAFQEQVGCADGVIVELAEIAEIEKDGVAVNEILPGLDKVMSISSSGVGEVNKATGYDTAKDAADLLVRPYPEMGEDALRDMERAAEPGWKDGVAGADAAKHISTAFIRNAPMMSPWEIGFIHRGVKWQTLNIKNSMMPTNGFADNGSYWDKEGTTYTDGDGAILDQIKMVDQSNTYGKINVNLLHPKHLDFRTKEDKAMVQALFQGIRYGENPLDFIKNSTRNSNGEFPTQSGGTLINKTAAIAIADDFILNIARKVVQEKKRTFLIGITGESASGKTVFAIISICTNIKLSF